VNNRLREGNAHLSGSRLRSRLRNVVRGWHRQMQWCSTELVGATRKNDSCHGYHEAPPKNSASTNSHWSTKSIASNANSA
jgi:hypothetical protein